MSDTASQFTPTPPPSGSEFTSSPPTGAPAITAGSAVAAPQPARLRLWPGVVIVVLQLLAIFVPEWLSLEPVVQFMAMMFAPMVGGAAIALWWLFASRIRWADRFIVLLVFALCGGAMWLLSHPSVSAGGYGLLLYGLPTATTCWVLWLLVTPFLRWPTRRATLLVVFVLAWGYFTLLRVDGVFGDLTSARNWRWTPTAEQEFMAQNPSVTGEGSSTAQLKLADGDWPGFRGPQRDGRRPGERIRTDWKARPPKEIWRHRVGPGWGSFAVIGKRLFTMEQWDQEEAVVCYDAVTGNRVWVHKDPVRFEEMVGGAGPRSTPTFREGKLFTYGAKGLLNCLDAASGKVLWSRNIVEDTGAKVPYWAFASSPLVTGGLVIVYAGAPEGKALVAYAEATGKPAWSAGEGNESYSSPQLARLGGVEQVLLATELGLSAFDPRTGKVLWVHDWPVEKTARIIQPALLEGGDVLIGTGNSPQSGTRRIHVEQGSSGWTQEAVWTTRAIKPYFNDLVTHKGYFYGFDDNFFTCVSLQDGQARWRARGYDHGQVLLLPDQDLLLITAERGAVALVKANPDKHEELGRFRPFEGRVKVWNHPVVVRGKLYVRNDEWAACYELADDAGDHAAGK
jgi:outer membrane protein assembly factor BamB